MDYKLAIIKSLDIMRQKEVLERKRRKAEQTVRYIK